MFRIKKGVRGVYDGDIQELHYTAPDIYDQKVKASVISSELGNWTAVCLNTSHINIYLPPCCMINCSPAGFQCKEILYLLYRFHNG